MLFPGGNAVSAEDQCIKIKERIEGRKVQVKELGCELSAEQQKLIVLRENKLLFVGKWTHGQTQFEETLRIRM
jgi:hypothetical protein